VHVRPKVLDNLAIHVRNALDRGRYDQEVIFLA
jgi:hypothetical protein